MILENHVPSLELCKKWKEIGGRKDTTISWFNSEEDVWILVSTIEYFGHSLISAPLASEMMEWLPTFTLKRIDWVYALSKLVYLRVGFDSFPNALMQMCIDMEGKK